MKKTDNKENEHPLFTAKERIFAYIGRLWWFKWNKVGCGQIFFILRLGWSLLMNQPFTLFILAIHPITESKNYKPAFTMFTFDNSSKWTQDIRSHLF